MKIGIFTFHRSRNYGAILQAYGLVKALKEMGHQPEIVDYCCVSIETPLRLWNPGNGVSHTTKQFLFRWRKKCAFDRFIRKHLPLSHKKNMHNKDLYKAVQNYNCLLTGSDQVWNSRLTGDDGAYFLDFPTTGAYKIAYAASAGDSAALSKKLLCQLQDFSAVSVREKSLKEYLDTKGIPSSVCCDPTLLIDPSDFLNMKSKRLNKSKYLFLFMIWESPDLISLAEKYAREKGYQVISNKRCLPFFHHCRPEDFLSWIYHAECVITNSFHASVFSLKFHKPLLVTIQKPNGQKNYRIAELLSDMDCLDCILEKKDVDRLNFPPIDYERVDVKIQEKRQISLTWLKNSLNQQIDL